MTGHRRDAPSLLLELVGHEIKMSSVPAESGSVEHDFIGTLNFQSDKVTRSLVTKGDLYAIIDPVTNGFQSMHGTDPVAVEVPIINGRGKFFTVDENGFALVDHVLPSEVDFTNDDAIVNAYYPLIAEFVKQHLGAYKAYGFDHYVRSGSGSMKYEIREGQKIGGPATVVHGDYALEGAVTRRDNFALSGAKSDAFKSVYGDAPLIPPEEFEQLRHRRFAIINLWRSLAPVGEPLVDMPLTICDAATTTPNDYATIEFRYEDRVIETYMGLYSPTQKWYYFPEMMRDEGVLLKTFDSQGKYARDHVNADGSRYPYYLQDQPAVNSFSNLHSAVKDPRVGEDAPTRKSIEVRVIVFY